ncbi:MAG: bifunctional alpha/beta hydrolase/OsmC family protein [Wenzhouxiangella sp.]|nr:bifunctional alpha/beta hydrolase/OsmC family protein [Wenzhouxiangella sp.]
MSTERFELIGHNGDVLAARLDLPDNTPHASALFAHCFTCSKDLKAVRNISKALTEQGIAVLRFDFTGLGHSQGEFANTNFSSNVEDLVLAAQALTDRIGAPEILIGHSLGGAAAIQAAPQLASLRCLVTIAAPADPAHITQQLSEHVDTIERSGQAQVNLAGREFTIKKQFLEDVSQHNIQHTLSDLRLPFLILHSPLDQTVGIDEASALFLAAKHPKSFISLDQADHLLTDEADARYVAALIGAWAQRYLDAPADTAGKAAKSPATDETDNRVVVSESSADTLKQDIVVNAHHQLVADEPPKLGGDDQGPNPFDYLCVALGACTAMTIRMYARHKKLNLDHVRVEVTHHKDDNKADVFDRFVTLTGALDQADHDRLIEIASRCPVHRTLEHTAQINTHPCPTPTT